MTRANLAALTGDYGHRLGRLTGAQLQAAVSRFDLGRLVDAAPIPGGLFGQNVHLTTDSGAWILRGCPHYDWQFPKERFFAREIASRSSIPAPWPYLIEPSREVFGWSYALMPCLPGLQLSNPTVRARVTPSEDTSIAQALGTGPSRLHEMTWAHPGTYSLQQNDVMPDECSHRVRVLGEIDDLVAQCGRLESLTNPDLRWLRTLVDCNLTSLDVPFEPTFVHHDFTAANVVVSRGPTAWSVFSVFDLMETYVRAPGRASTSSAPKAALVVTLRPSSAALGRRGGCVASGPRLPLQRYVPFAPRHLEGAGSRDAASRAARTAVAVVKPEL